MRIKMEDEDSIDINMGPLIDCVFLLLIFFLVATTLKKPEEQPQPEKPVEEQIIEELDIELPEPAISAGVNTDSAPFLIEIDSDGNYYLGRRPVGQQDLHTRLRKLAGQNPNWHIRIHVDKRAPSQYLIQLIDLCSFEGLKNYGIRTQVKD